MSVRNDFNFNAKDHAPHELNERMRPVKKRGGKRKPWVIEYWREEPWCSRRAWELLEGRKFVPFWDRHHSAYATKERAEQAWEILKKKEPWWIRKGWKVRIRNVEEETP